ncbi:unnamed protein product [Polarella glacialis]|uniref:Uncharacterized protein n=1 Tax=Polarella glacialis TaxID=89957 RepID=A0A813GKR1_POLGL|nr:unnamed protein product [Polarella glacialis]CAE8688570.1 unnamed protein product [Polarella glacialis]
MAGNSVTASGTLSQALDALHAQQQQLGVLSKRLVSLGDEHEALCECLAAHGAVGAERFMAGLHRQRFAVARRRHPLRSEESLESIMQAKEFALTVAARLGLSGIASLGAASKALRIGVTAISPELVFPISLYAIGGEAGGDALASVECFSVPTNSWSSCPSLETPRSGCAAVALSHHVYAVGGCGSDGEDLRTVERLNLWDSVWEAMPSMLAGRDELAAAASGGHVYAIGGSHLVWPVRHVMDAVERFDPETRSWQAMPRMSRERCAAAAVSTGGRVYVLGGCNQDGIALDSAERFDTWKSIWEPLPPMRRPRCNFAVAASNGHVFVAGGYDDRMQDLDTVERLDSNLDCGWEAIACLAMPRWGVRAVGRAGAVFVVGGHVRDGEVGTTERLDPSSGEWVTLAPLLEPRRSFGLAASCLN